MLIIDDLCIRYPNSNKWALESLTFNIEKPELVVFAGASGSGKSTLAQTLLTLIPYFQDAEVRGKIVLENKDLNALSRQEMIDLMGYVPQYPADFLTSLIVEEEIVFPLENRQFKQQLIHNSLKKITEELDITHLLRRLVTELSSGELQRVEIATAFAHIPKIVVLDEPLARIDSASEEKLVHFLKHLVSKGHLVLVFEHRLDYLFANADRVIVLEEGKIVANNTPDRVIEHLRHVDLAEVSELLSFNSQPILTIEEAKTLLSKKANKLKLYSEYKKLESKQQNDSMSLILEDMSFSYPSYNRSVIENLTTSFSFGETFALLGTNGCGKSTLLRLIAGTLKTKSGKIFLHGKRVTKTKLLTQQSTLIPENAKLFLIGPTPEKDLFRILKNQQKVDEIFERYNVNELKSKKLYHLSEGERRLIAIIIAFHTKSDIILLDEPSIGLDERGRNILFSLLYQAKEMNKLVIIASNDPRLFPYFSEAKLMGDKKIVLEGTTRDVLYSLKDKSKILPNQTIRVIQQLNKALDKRFYPYISIEEINSDLEAL